MGPWVPRDDRKKCGHAWYEDFTQRREVGGEERAVAQVHVSKRRGKSDLWCWDVWVLSPAWEWAAMGHGGTEEQAQARADAMLRVLGVLPEEPPAADALAAAEELIARRGWPSRDRAPEYIASILEIAAKLGSAIATAEPVAPCARSMMEALALRALCEETIAQVAEARGAMPERLAHATLAFLEGAGACFAARQAAKEHAAACTGLTAVWCPVHGDCTCPYENDDPNQGRTMDDAGCPLHAPESPHAEGGAA